MKSNKKFLEQRVAIDDCVEVDADINQVARRDVLRTILALRNNFSFVQSEMMSSLSMTTTSVDRRAEKRKREKECGNEVFQPHLRREFFGIC